MIRGKFNQGKCQVCGSWHFAVQMDDNRNITEFKCCKCNRLIDAKLFNIQHTEPKIEEKKGE